MVEILFVYYTVLSISFTTTRIKLFILFTELLLPVCALWLPQFRQLGEQELVKP